MIDVIQMFKSIERFKKDDYDAGKLPGQGEVTLNSGTGYLSGRILYLPDTGLQPPGLYDAHTIILQDIPAVDPFAVTLPLESSHQPRWVKDTNKNHVLIVSDQSICFYRLAGSLTFEIFRIEKKEPGTFCLYLNYTGNQFVIGIPERDDHKIAELKLNKPVRFRINGKSDFTLSGRKQRTFAEYDYTIEYLGQAEKIVFEDLNKVVTTKIKPGKESKLVDERKILK